jgi:signal peptidase I
MSLWPWSRQRKNRKMARDLLRHARHLRLSREDEISEDDGRRLARLEADLNGALRAGADAATLEKAGDALYRCILDLTPARPFPWLRENFEVLVVALSVAMGVRAYFVQPFKIPTGSMEPTLCGIQTRDNGEPGHWDRIPLKFVKWAATGEWRMVVRAANSGVFTRPAAQSATMEQRVNQVVLVGERPYTLPRNAKPLFEEEAFVRKGQILWSGSRTSGDHVFVNKVAWNFRRPRRGEVIVFRTDTIPIVPPVPPGTHYIKRLVAVPGDELSIAGGRLLIGGEAVQDPRHRAMRRLADASYPEYQGIGHGGGPSVTSTHALRDADDSIPLGAGQYFALGDNADSSLDGRYWGPVPEKHLVGPAFMVYWPFSKRWGWIR